ncbi:MAG: hypothetical protein N3E36_06645 [Sulfolobales archaeon]|nr:hypothetical protein [Sulfolobales archaeon]MCX8199679.1 hypothetical protein [Sulfolobales archaeon]MDW8170633.1 hypothetical protein [Desulfurococcaceae archaeon]
MDVTLIIPPTPWGYIIEDIVKAAASISMKLGALVRLKILYTPDDEVAILSIDGNEVVFKKDGEVTIESLVDVITMYSIPTTLTKSRSSSAIAT